MKNYYDFLSSKQHLVGEFGFNPTFMPDAAFDFQQYAIEWAMKKGRASLFADCGMGKTLMELTFSQNVVEKTNKPVLLLTPLAVAAQTISEGEKFGVEAERSSDGKFSSGARVIVTNYQKLHHFNPSDFAGTVCDESSILKNFDGATKAQVTEFMKKQPYRLLCTATAAPNDFIELGTSSEALGHLGYMDVISKFFKKNEATTSRKDETKSGVYRFRGHSERDFWRWVCSWAKAFRKPSDLGFDDGTMKLPELKIRNHVINPTEPTEGFLFTMPAKGLKEQRSERSRTTKERCELASKKANEHEGASVMWGHLNYECDMLTQMTDGAVQVKGSDSDEYKEEVFIDFQAGRIKKLVTKPSIAGFGLNWQHCAHQTFFPSHSFEQWYQCIRRSWRFGQKKEVSVDVITSEGESYVLENFRRKQDACDKMFQNLVDLMNNELILQKKERTQSEINKPSFL